MKELNTSKRKRWTENEDKLLAEKMKEETLEEIAKELGRTTRAVKMHLHFQRAWGPPDSKANLLIAFLKKVFIHPENFRPTGNFYRTVHINRSRFWKLYRGEARLTETEYQALTTYFGVAPEKAFEARQLNLFEDVNK